MMVTETAMALASEHPYATASIIAGIVGIPWGITKQRQSARSLYSLGNKTGLIAWAAGLVYLANNWPTVARFGRWVLSAAVAVTLAIVWHLYPARSTFLIIVCVAIGGGYWVYQWLDGADPTLANFRAARRRHDATTVMRQTLAAVTPEGAPPRTGRVVEDDAGRLAIHVEPAPGENLTAIQEAALNGAIGNAARQIGEKYGLNLAVTGSFVTPDGVSEGEASLICHTGGDPLADTIWPPDTWPTDVDTPLTVGTDEMGQPPTLDLEPEIAMVVAGLKGIGKSMFVASLIDQLAARDHTAIVLCDPKMQEFAPWAQRASTVGLGIPGTDVVIRLVYLEMKARQKRYKATVDTDGEVIGSWSRKPGRAECSRIVLIVDEVAEVPATKPKDAYLDALLTTLYPYGVTEHPEAAVLPARNILQRIVTLGRSVNMSQILATQRPAADVLPTGIRDNCDVFVGFALHDADATTMVFGNAHVPCHDIPVSSKGVGYVRRQTERAPIKFRGYMMEDARIIATARATRAKRVDLGWPLIIEQPTQPTTSEED